MEARKRWAVLSVGFNPEAEYLPEVREANVKGMFWTGRHFYPMWTHEIKSAKTFATKDEADSAALFFAAKQPEWFGRVTVYGYLDMDEQ